MGVEKKGIADKVQYFRYQDDILILAKTRWHLRQAIKIIKQHVSKLNLELHPGKTFIGRTSHGFDFLGYHFNAKKISGVSKTCLDRFTANITRLYEQKSSLKRLEKYWRRWITWAKSALNLDENVITNIINKIECLFLPFLPITHINSVLIAG